jgi:hypothetical protein
MLIYNVNDKGSGAAQAACAPAKVPPAADFAGPFTID